MFGNTRTSNRSGAWISCMHSASMIRSSNAMSGKSSATSRATSRNNPSENFMMLALWEAVTRARPCSFAHLNANRTIRSEAGAADLLDRDAAVGSHRAGPSSPR